MKRKRFYIPDKSLQSRTTPIRSIIHAASTLLERMVPTVLCYLIPTSSTIYSPGGQSLAPPVATLGGVHIFTPVLVFTPVPLLFYAFGHGFEKSFDLPIANLSSFPEFRNVQGAVRKV
ncbi:hypothetical protein AVEN_110606-1 [Araneus ventricosus]|uniref:Uncharacterized protein n=1 Tax=Araneus ventricosus TaxID=182803 RepID=A0A4Y2ATW1_ARAVE|nr:hypothetical protein AVEN_110606-1 [Araneus ventricosus]